MLLFKKLGAGAWPFMGEGAADGGFWRITKGGFWSTASSLRWSLLKFMDEPGGFGGDNGGDCEYAP
jgi:hypothetical protein